MRTYNTHVYMIAKCSRLLKVDSLVTSWNYQWAWVFLTRPIKFKRL